MKVNLGHRPLETGGVVLPLLGLLVLAGVVAASFIFTEPARSGHVTNPDRSASPNSSSLASAPPKANTESLPTPAGAPLDKAEPEIAAARRPVSSAMQYARDLNRAFIELAETVQPSVVVIKVVQKAAQPDDAPSHPLFDNLPDELKKEFEKYFDRNGPKRRGRPERQQGQGSGVIMREDGYILTNDHVVENAEEITVVLKDGREFPAEVRGLDPKSDLAVIKLKEAAPGLVVARFADSDSVRVGEFAIAIGAPFELDYSVTFGHVSAKGRSDVVPNYLSRQAGGMDQDFIQTDASINPGNSGGPLVNIEGEVIGINSLIRGMSTGIGFAIPSNLARRVGESIIVDGKFARSWLGIGLESLKNSPGLRETVQDLKDGVVVRSLIKGGPAAKSDLKPNDIITSVDGRKVATVQGLRNEIRDKKPGSLVMLDVHWIGEDKLGKSMRIEVRPEPWPEEEEEPRALSQKSSPIEGESAELGITVKPWSLELAKRFELPIPKKGEKKPEGMVITSVTPDGVAGQEGLEPGDIISEVNQETITSVTELKESVAKYHGKEGGLMLTIVNKRTGEAEMLKIEGK